MSRAVGSWVVGFGASESLGASAQEEPPWQLCLGHVLRSAEEVAVCMGRKGRRKLHLHRELPGDVPGALKPHGERLAVEERLVSFGEPGVVRQVTGRAAGEKLESFDQEGE